MARLQDFQTVTPTSADKLLVVQSQGQGLVPYGSKLDSANPTGTGSLSINRKANTTTGAYSVAEGINGTASGQGSHAEGNESISSGNYAHSEGYVTQATAQAAHAEGQQTVASGQASYAGGNQTIANHAFQHVFGAYNVADTSTAASTARGTYIEIVGNGGSSINRGNARTLDWAGNEVLAGGLKVNGNQDVGIAPIGYNANTDRNTESVRQTAMRYLRTNCFSKGGSSSSVRYSGGYYFTYLFGGVTSYGYDTFVEFAQSLTSGEKVIYWGYNVSTDTFTKLFSIS